MKIISILLLVSNFAWADGTWSDSGIKGPKYAEILKSMESLQTEFPAMTSIVDYGTTKKGRTLRMVIVKKPGRFENRPAVLITGSTHGNEYLNIEDRLPMELTKRSRETGTVTQYLDAGGVFLFVPILNPDGYEARQRENSNGVDLNRDWDVPAAQYKGFKEIETRTLSEMVKQQVTDNHLKLKVTVDYHCCIGALLHPYSFEPAPELPAEALANHKAIGELANRNLDVEVGTTPGLLGYSAWGTTKDYYYDTYQAAGFTFEGRYAEENQKLSQHIQWWEDILKYVVDRDSLPLFASLGAAKRPFLRIAE